MTETPRQKGDRMPKQKPAAPRREWYAVMVVNEFAEGGRLLHKKMRSRSAAVRMADAIARSGEVASVYRIDDDGELVPSYVADGSNSGYLHKWR